MPKYVLSTALISRIISASLKNSLSVVKQCISIVKVSTTGLYLILFLLPPLPRDVTRGPYEPYVRHRHTAPAYRTGCQLESWHPYPVSGRLFTVYSRTLTSVYGRHTDHSSEHTGALVVTRLPSFLARSPSSISATCHYLSIFVRRLFLSHFPHFFFL
jgi:hypothetical protein